MKNRRKSTDFIVIHCSATSPDMDIGANEIRRWHTDPPPSGRGWKDIGYAEVIRRDGTAEPGRNLDDAVPSANEVGAHVLGFNGRSVGICLIGGIDRHGKSENNFTGAQFSSLRLILRFYKALFPEALIVGHHELDKKKDCPSFDVQAWLKKQNL